jgi:PIN domain nuclease of toxin-antitoxin system
VKFLLDTHLLLWASGAPERLATSTKKLLEAPEHELVFSVASLWEVAIKSTLGREDFKVDAGVLRRGLIENGYIELAVAGVHAVASAALPPLHRDPFDRLLIAQAAVEGITLLTSDVAVAAYPGPIRKV